MDTPIISKFKSIDFNTDSKPKKLTQDNFNKDPNNNDNLKIPSRSMNNTKSTLIDPQENSDLNNKYKKNKNPLLFDSEEFIHKYDMANIIPKSSILKIDDEKFISRGEVQKIIESRKNQRKYNIESIQKLTPFQKNENYKNFLKEKLQLIKEVNGDKGIVMKNTNENLKDIDIEELNFHSSSCTILSYDKNSNEKYKGIIFNKLRKDNSLLDLANTSREYLPNIGNHPMSNTSYGKEILLNN